MDPLSITVSAVTLVTVCLKSSALLYKAIEGFNSSRTDVERLKADVGDLNIVLQALEKNMQESSENFDTLKLILQQCVDACDEFRKEVMKALGGSGERLQGVKAWVKLQYHGNDIEGFRKLIASYKATMTIALADSNLRTSKVTKELLEAYIEMTKTTASNLKDQIDELGAKLDLVRFTQHNDVTDTTKKQTLDQKTSLEQCLSICQNLLLHIEEIKPSVSEKAGDTSNNAALEHVDEVNILAPRIVSSVLELCTQNIKTAETHMRELHESNRSKSKSDEARVMQQLNSAQQCLNIVKHAQQHRINTYEKIDTGEDSHQFIVSTIGDLIKANGLTVGARSVNVMGQMSDESLQKLTEKLPSPVPQKSASPYHQNVSFEKRHGYGKTVS